MCSQAENRWFCPLQGPAFPYLTFRIGPGSEILFVQESVGRPFLCQPGFRLFTTDSRRVCGQHHGQWTAHSLLLEIWAWISCWGGRILNTTPGRSPPFPLLFFLWLFPILLYVYSYCYRSVFFSYLMRQDTWVLTSDRPGFESCRSCFRARWTGAVLSAEHGNLFEFS